jgi:hypothetical protein
VDTESNQMRPGWWAAPSLGSCFTLTKIWYIVQVASAFSQMLNLHNLSEEISNAQIEKASRIGEVGRSIKLVHPQFL